MSTSVLTRSSLGREEPNPGRIPPVLRWAGGKTRLTTRLLPLVPKDARNVTYWEPFLGGGALFFALQPRRANLSDANAHLVDFYDQLTKRPDLLHRYLRELAADSSEGSYYAIRMRYNRGKPSPMQAARFLYLNKHSYNGVFRVNKRGEYNVPYGKRDRYVLPSREHLHRAAAALNEVSLSACSYREILPRVRGGCFVYLDPPYPPLNGTSFFTHYTADRFSEADQRELAGMVNRLDAIGARFMMTNADVPLVRELYGQYLLHPLSVTRYVTCKKRKLRVAELVVTNYEPSERDGVRRLGNG